jgi:hypothetical protein
MLLFSRIQSYYQAVGLELGLGRHPPRSLPAGSLVIVPVGSIRKLTEHALHAALSLGDDVIAVRVHPETSQSAAFRAEWDRWDPGVRLDTIDSPHRSLVHPIIEYVQRAQQAGRQVAVLIPESSHDDGGTGSCRTSVACSWRPSCAPAPTSSSAPSPTGSPLDNESPGAHCARPDLPAASNAGASGQDAPPASRVPCRARQHPGSDATLTRAPATRPDARHPPPGRYRRHAGLVVLARLRIYA